MSYPKWVRRAPHIGPVLCLSSDEERKLLADWDKEQIDLARAAADEANRIAKEAEEQAKLSLSPPPPPPPPPDAKLKTK